MKIKKICLAFAVACAFGAGGAQAATELQWWHSMTGALGDRVNDIANKFILVALVVRHAYRRPVPQPSAPTMNLRDPLTGLPSPECFEAELAHVSAISDRYRFPLTLVGCRIVSPGADSQFDRLLCKCADAIADRLRTADTACRWNPTTFMLLLPNTGEKEAGIVANGIQETIRQLEIKENSPLTVALRVARHQAGEDPMNTVSALENELAKTVE